MLPDLDSGPGRPLHESVSFAAAAIPMMMVDRFRHWGWTHESMILAGAAIYLFIRFGVGHMLKKWTVHRGIFHSFPVALVFTEIGVPRLHHRRLEDALLQGRSDQHRISLPFDSR